MGNIGDNIKKIENDITELNTKIYNQNYDLDQDNDQNAAKNKGEEEIGDPNKRFENADQFE